MPRLQVQFWSRVSITGSARIDRHSFGVGPSPSESQPKSDSKTADKTDVKSEDGTKTKTKTKAKGESEAVTKTESRLAASHRSTVAEIADQGSVFSDPP